LLEFFGTGGADGLIFKEKNIAICRDRQFACAANQTFGMILLFVDNDDLAVAENLTTAGTSLHTTHAAQKSINKGWLLVAKHIIALLAVEACSVVAHTFVYVGRQHSWDETLACRANSCSLVVALRADNSLGSRHHEILGFDFLLALAAFEAVLFRWWRRCGWRRDRRITLGCSCWCTGRGRTCRRWNSSGTW